MKRLREKKKTAEASQEEVEDNKDLAPDEAPQTNQRCVRPGTRKETMGLRRNQMPKHSKPRSQYKDEVKMAELYAEELKKPKIEMAKDKGLIWNGIRSHIGWTNKTKEDFWKNHEKNGGWVCKLKIPGKCIQLTVQDNHKKLAIGHDVSFYTNIGDNCGRILFCDGIDHWLGYLRSSVITVNENLTNLEPQCKKCNGNTHTEGRGDFQPQKMKDGGCPGKEDCHAAYFIKDDGSLITPSERITEEAESEGKNEEKEIEIIEEKEVKEVKEVKKQKKKSTSFFDFEFDEEKVNSESEQPEDWDEFNNEEEKSNNNFDWNNQYDEEEKSSGSGDEKYPVYDFGIDQKKPSKKNSSASASEVEDYEYLIDEENDDNKLGHYYDEDEFSDSK